MRITVGLHSPQLGGSQINTIDLANRLRARGHDVQLFVIDQPVDVSVLPIARAAGFDVRVLPAEGSLVRQAAHITGCVDEFGAEVVHVYHEDHWLGPLAAIALRSRPGRALVVTNWMMKNNSWLPRHAPLIVGTEELRDEAERLQRGPVWLLEPPVDTDRDEPDPQRAATYRCALGVSGSEMLVVLVTRVDRAMKLDGIMRAIDAIRLLDDPSVRLAIVGDGNAMDLVRGRARAVNDELGREAVLLTGALSDPRPAYDAADVVLGMGGSALRGLAFARPVVVLGERGFARIFDPESAGYFLRHGYYGHGDDDGQPDGSRLAGLLSALTAGDVRASLADFGSELVRERYALEAATDRLEQIYRHALAKPIGVSRRWSDVAYVLTHAFVHRRFPAGLRGRIRSLVPRLRG